jgi:hypothetical protein
LYPSYIVTRDIAMYKSWWWNRAAWKLDKRKARALTYIEGERLLIEEMVQRPREVNDPLNQALFDTVIRRLEEIAQSAKSENDFDRLGTLMDDAETHGGQYRAYFCPAGDVQREGELIISIITTEWGLPKSVTEDLRKNAAALNKSPAEARAALHHLFSERDSWDDYTNDYEDTMRSYTRVLFMLTVGLPVLSAFCFRYAFHSHFRWLLVLGVVAAGVAGSSVSIMRKMPEFDVKLSNELDAYRRRIMSRMGVGIAASLIGSALLGWGVLPVSIQGQTFTDAVRACTTSICSGIHMLLLLGVPMVLGFSERALTAIEERLFGVGKTRKTS